MFPSSAAVSHHSKWTSGLCLPVYYSKFPFCCCSMPSVSVDFGLCLPAETTALPTAPRETFYYQPEEEIARGPAAWLWDYLRRRCCQASIEFHSGCRFLARCARPDGNLLVQVLQIGCSTLHTSTQSLWKHVRRRNKQSTRIRTGFVI